MTLKEAQKYIRERFNEAHRAWLDLKKEPYTAINIHEKLKNEEVLYAVKEAYYDCMTTIETIDKKWSKDDEIYFSK